MDKQIRTGEVDQSVFLLREHISIIRINLEILECLHLSGRIKGSDKQYIEIMELDQKTRKSFHEYVLGLLPGLMAIDLEPGNRVLKKSFLDWAADLQLRLSYLDRIIKEYMHQMVLADKNGKSDLNNKEIRDKRFWKFLEKVKSKARLFEIFNEPGTAEFLNQANDSKKSEE